MQISGENKGTTHVVGDMHERKVRQIHVPRGAKPKDSLMATAHSACRCPVCALRQAGFALLWLRALSRA